MVLGHWDQQATVCLRGLQCAGRREKVRTLLQERTVWDFESTEQGCYSLKGPGGVWVLQNKEEGPWEGKKWGGGPCERRHVSWEGREGRLLRFTWAPPSRLERLWGQEAGSEDFRCHVAPSPGVSRAPWELSKWQIYRFSQRFAESESLEQSRKCLERQEVISDYTCIKCGGWEETSLI